MTSFCLTFTLDLELPQHWEPMNGEDFKKVELQCNSTEYKKVSDEFLKTAQYNILKVSMREHRPF